MNTVTGRIVPISGSITLSFLQGLNGPNSFEVGLMFNGSCFEVVPMEWHDMAEIVAQASEGVFTFFPNFHQYLLTGERP